MRNFYRLLLGLLFIGFTACQHPAPPANALHYNAKSEVIDGIEHHNSFAAYVLRTDAPSLTVRARTTFTAPYLDQASLAVFVDGVYKFTLHLVGGGKEESFEVALVGGRSQEVRIQEGPQQRALEQGPLNFTTITSIEPASGHEITWLSPVRAAEGIFVFGDSRVHGGVNPEVGRTAWPVQLRTLHPTADVYVSGYSSLQIGAHLDTDEKRRLLTSEVKRALQPYTRQVLWPEAGVNDYEAGPYTPAQLGGFYRQWLQQLHEALPRLTIKLQTDIVKAVETKNKLGYTLSDYRQAEADAGMGLSYVEVVDGLKLAEALNLKDGVHLNVKGDSIFALDAASVLK